MSDHKPHMSLHMFEEKLEIARIKTCEVRSVDPNVEQCHTDASHVVRELGIVICAAHVQTVESIHEDQMGSFWKAREAAHVAAEKAENEKVREEKTDALEISLPVADPSSADAGGSDPSVSG